MTKATDKELSILHKQLATAFRVALEAKDEALALLNEYEDLPDAVKGFLERFTAPNPSLLTAAAKFLKDNNITCVVDDNNDLSATAQMLQNKRKITDVPIEGTQH